MARLDGGNPELDSDAVLKFFERRGASADKQSHYAVTAFSDVQTAEQRHIDERNCVFDKLNLPNPNARVLDIGCGGGRWAKSLVQESSPPVEYYSGIDFSPSLIELSRALNLGPKADFEILSAQDFGQGAGFESAKFTHILIVAVAIYLNDDIIDKILKRAKSLLSDGGRIYFREGICIGPSRLTLVEEASAALQDNYNAIYRTTEEYKNIIEKCGLRIIEDSDLPSSLFQRHSTTRHHYFICE